MASYENINNISVDQLAAVVKNKIEKVLIIDSRSFLEFNTCHVINAVNVCCSKLVKRRLQQDKVSVKELLMNTCHRIIHESFDVIVYDQNSSDMHTISSDSFLFVILSKLIRIFKSVNLLQGGFLEFQSKYPALCEDKTRKCVPLTSMSQPCLPISNTGPTRILPFLYLGSQNDAMNKDLLKDHNITYELNVSAACPKPDFIPEGHFLRIPVNDNYSEKLLPHFPLAFQFVDKVREANGCVLIHCLAGISRSPTVAIAYIMQYLHMSSDDAYRYVKSKRATISPNFNFLGQLLEYEHQLRMENVFKNKPGLYPSPFGNGNKRHCRNARRDVQKLDLKFSTFGNADDIKKAGALSPTSALAKLNFNCSDNDPAACTTNEEEILGERQLHNNLEDGKMNSVQKSSSASNLRTSLFISNGRRFSFDAGSKHHSSENVYKKLSSSGYKCVSFEGLKGIPVSSLENINFTPCQTSESSNLEHKQKSGSFKENYHSPMLSSNCFPPETSHCKNMNVSFNFSLQTQVWHSSKDSETYSGIFKHLNNPMNASVPFGKLYNKTEKSLEKNTGTRESSPRPASILISPLTPAECDEDEGIDIRKEDGKPNLDVLPQGMQVLSHTLESGTSGVADQGECLESSYDSGVYPSPTQFIPFASEIFPPLNTSESDWSNVYKETSSKFNNSCYSDLEKNKALINMSLHSNNFEVCNSQSISETSESFTPVEKLRLTTTTTVFRDKSFHINSCHKEERLYRAQSCPGILSFIHCTQSLDKTSTNTTILAGEIRTPQLRRLKLSSVERGIRLRNRYSCDSIDYNDERSNFTFDSCPDFVHYGNNCQNDRDSGSSHEHPSLNAYQSFLQNTGIIKVS